MKVKIILLSISTVLCFFYPSFGQKKSTAGGSVVTGCQSLPGDFTFDFNACNQLQVNFANTSINHKNPLWTFGDGNAGNGDSVTDTYQSPGIYTVQMIAKNRLGCIDTFTKSFIINITQGGIFVPDKINACINGTTRLPGDSTALQSCWSPATYLDSTDIYDPLISPKGNITYQYNEVAKGANLIINGGFENGNIDFNSGYIYDSSINTNGYYYVTANSMSWDTLYHICPYDSTLYDTLMLVNGATAPNVLVWSKRVSVSPFTNYLFIFHATPLIPVDSLILDVTFNNTELNNEFLLPGSICSLRRYRITWFSGSDTSLIIKLYDLDTSQNNNAFALNNITFNPFYLASDSLTADVVGLPKITVSNNDTLCLGDSTILSANAPFTSQYKWRPSAGLNFPGVARPVASPKISTNYFVTATDSNLCSNTDSVFIEIVPKPALTVIKDTLLLCAGDSVLLDINAQNATSFNWLPSNYLNNSSVAQPFAKPPSSTKYILTAANKYCAVEDSVFVNVVSLPAVKASDDTITCIGNTLHLFASGGNIYAWSPVNGLSNPFIANPSAIISKAIKYYVTVADSNHCSATDSVSIAIETTPFYGVQPASASVCAGDSLTISAFGGNQYIWSPSSTVANPSSQVSSVFPVTNTTYKIIINDTSCHFSDSVFVVVNISPNPTVTISKSNDVDCVIGSSDLKATGGVSYSWHPANSLSDATIATPVAVPQQTTTYYVTVTGADGCITEDSILVLANTGNVNNGYLVPSAFTPNNDGLNDCFGIKKWGVVSNLEFNVYNRSGNLVFSTSNPSVCWDGTYKGLPQPAGTYVYYIKAETICGEVNRNGTVILIR